VAKPRGLSLRNRILIAFIALAFLPCLVLTAFVSEKLSRSLAFWGRPGVERTVDSSVSAARLALFALKEHLRDAVDGVAEGKPAPGGLDVLRIYELKDGRYILSEAEASAAGLLLAPEAIEGALHSTRVIERDEGYILAVAALDSAAQRVVVGGYALPPELFSQIAEARRGASFFDRLRLYLAVSQRWIWISTPLAISTPTKVSPIFETLPRTPPEVTTSSPLASASIIALCSFCRFICGRIMTK